jgi:spore germination protein GerM
MSALRRLAPAVLAAALVAGCGVSTDDQPQEISRSNVPEGFDDDVAATTDATDGTPRPGQIVGIFLLHEEAGEVTLIRRRRRVPVEPTDSAILEALLLEAPTRAERRASITTAIPSTTRLASTPERVDGVLVIDLSDGFFEVSGDDLRNAYAQVVCTADEIDGVRAVEFEIEGRRQDAFDGDGQSTARPMRCDDYSQLLPDT